MPPEIVQLISGTVSVLALIGGGIWWCVRRHINHLWRKIHGLEHRRKLIERKMDRARDRLDQAHDRARKTKARSAIQGERIR